jgi:hypothetical protein
MMTERQFSFVAVFITLVVVTFRYYKKNSGLRLKTRYRNCENCSARLSWWQRVSREDGYCSEMCKTTDMQQIAQRALERL